MMMSVRSQASVSTGPLLASAPGLAPGDASRGRDAGAADQGQGPEKFAISISGGGRLPAPVHTLRARGVPPQSAPTSLTLTGNCAGAGNGPGGFSDNAHG